MEVKKTVCIDLTEDELKSIISEYVSKKMNKDIKPESVSFQIGRKCDYDDRFSVEYLKGCTVIYSDN